MNSKEKMIMKYKKQNFKISKQFVDYSRVFKFHKDFEKSVEALYQNTSQKSKQMTLGL